MTVGSKFDIAIPICAAEVFDGSKSRLDRYWWWLHAAGRTTNGDRHGTSEIASGGALARNLRINRPARFGPRNPRHLSQTHADTRSTRHGIVRLAKGLRGAVAGSPGRGGAGATDRVREYCQPPDGARRRSQQGNGHAASAWGIAPAPDAATHRRVRPAFLHGRRARTAVRAVGRHAAAQLPLRGAPASRSRFCFGRACPHLHGRRRDHHRPAVRRRSRTTRHKRIAHQHDQGESRYGGRAAHPPPSVDRGITSGAFASAPGHRGIATSQFPQSRHGRYWVRPRPCPAGQCEPVHGQDPAVQIHSHI